MPPNMQMMEIDPRAVTLLVSITPMATGQFKSQLFPIQNINEFWQAFMVLLDATGATAGSMVKDNNLGITNHEDMAQYVSEHITRVIMTASPTERSSDAGPSGS